MITAVINSVSNTSNIYQGSGKGLPTSSYMGPHMGEKQVPQGNK